MKYRSIRVHCDVPIHDQILMEHGILWQAYIQLSQHIQDAILQHWMYYT
jgi:hypothetical protein